jgi:hypothetical protein
VRLWVDGAVEVEGDGGEVEEEDEANA